jgi:hypothetical protein
MARQYAVVHTRYTALLLAHRATCLRARRRCHSHRRESRAHLFFGTAFLLAAYCSFGTAFLLAACCSFGVAFFAASSFFRPFLSFVSFFRFFLSFLGELFRDRLLRKRGRPPRGPPFRRGSLSLGRLFPCLQMEAPPEPGSEGGASTGFPIARRYQFWSLNRGSEVRNGRGGRLPTFSEGVLLEGGFP